jgi:hypothetical protein
MLLPLIYFYFVIILGLQVIKKGKDHGPEKSRETQESKNQPETARILQQAKDV